MKKLILGLLLLVGFNGWGQEEALEEINSSISTRHRVITDSVTQYDAADRVYSNLQALVPTGKLYNRLMLEDTLESVVWNLNDITTNEDEGGGATADHAYGLLYEMRLMSFDTASVPGRIDVLTNVMDYMEDFEFDLDEYHYPIGIFDYKYNIIDEEQNQTNGNIYLQDSAYYLQSNELELTERKATLAAPLFDFHSSRQMAIVFRKENFYSNYRDVDSITKITIVNNRNIKELDFEETYYFTPNNKGKQNFYVEITYADGSSFFSFFTIKTPLLGDEGSKFDNMLKSGFGCDDEDEITENIGLRKLKLKWCLKERCGWNGRIYKPYILITGYRPPFIGQGYGTTWNYYNGEHNSMLDELRANGYDIILVKFNMHWRYEMLGIIEASKLLERLLLWVNEQKGGQGSGQENVIQGSSMGASVARLTLLRMEKKHFEDNSYPNHHSRLNIAYDGNFYGANLPLSYQAQIYSAYHHPGFGPASGPSVSNFLSAYLYLTLNQKATTDLLTYHVAAHNPLPFLFENENYTSYQPSHHPSRMNYLNVLNSVDNNYARTSIVPYTHFIPMPNAPRNISISLGHNAQANDVSVPGQYKPPGTYWRDINLGLWEYKLGTSKYMSGNNTFQIFKRKKFGFLGIGSVEHLLNVNQMREVDNASGSYLGGMGNLISVSDWTYFFWLTFGESLFTWSWDAKHRFSHKSVLTALAINKDLWPSNGSMTMNLKNLDLMGIKMNNNQLIQSNYIGYPNLGRPNDHFEVTPFEAIFCGPRIQAHIRLDQDDDDYIDSLKQYVLNEVEPWYLDLQNMRIGAQARSDYRYYSFRRAKHRIIVGEDVTPTTDKGAYIVESNGKLALHAGDAIILKPGVHFKAGSIVHIKPAYDICGNTKMVTNDGKNNEVHQNIEKTYFDRGEIVSNETEFQDFIIYPNPADNTVTIKSNDGSIAENITFYNLQGNVVLKNKSNQSLITVDIGNLNAGVYIIRISSNGKMFNKKLLVK